VNCQCLPYGACMNRRAGLADNSEARGQGHPPRKLLQGSSERGPLKMGMLLSQQVPRWFVLHACLDSVERLLVFAKDCVLMLSCMCAGMDFGQQWCRPSGALARHCYWLECAGKTLLNSSLCVCRLCRPCTGMGIFPLMSLQLPACFTLARVCTRRLLGWC
jgi:hypothetical protein